jgi:protein-L-isoaspartate O-methyltransferase
MRFDRPEQYLMLRDVLRQAGYTDANILGRIHISDFPSLRGEDLSMLLRRTEGGTPLDTFIRLFLLEVPCDPKVVSRAIAPMKLQDWVEAGLLQIRGPEIRAAIRLLPYREFLFAYDPPAMLTTSLKRHYVMGIGDSSLTLANLTIRRHSRLTLDLGAGCGFHALLAARHSDRVMAVDINPRAVEFAQFNARLNGLEQIECIEGNLFDPVQGLKFDLIVTNPPFVISPEQNYIYRDGGLTGDELCQSIVRRAPEVLEENGFCKMLCNWAEYDGQDWDTRLRGWFAGTGCDVWVLRSESRDIATYAYTWIRHTEKDQEEDPDERFKAWMAYYERLGISRISAGVIIMRRRPAAAHWFRADGSPEKMIGPCGEQILLGFQLRDFLDGADDRALMDARLAISPDARLERVCAPSPEGWKDEAARLYLRTGLAYAGNIDPLAANFLIRCDGTRPLGEILNDISVATGAAAAEIAPAFCAMARNLIEHGFLVPRRLP